MKVNISVDLTPEEMRRVLGLPDVQELHRDLIEQVRARMQEGVEGYDPLDLLKPYMPTAMEPLQNLFSQFLNVASGKTETGKKGRKG